MEEHQPIIVPPRARVPQHPPQWLASNRRVCIPPTYKRTLRQPYAPLPMPLPSISPRFLYPVSGITQLPSTGQADRPFPAGYISPAFALPTTPGRLSEAPRTPRLLTYDERTAYMALRRGIQPAMSLRSLQSDTPVTPPISIPGSALSDGTRQEPGVWEALLGCCTLILIGIIFLAILYYIST